MGRPSTCLLLIIGGLLTLGGCNRDWREMRAQDAARPRAEAPAAADPVRDRDRQVAERIADLTCRLHTRLAPADENLAWSPLEATAGASLLLAGSTGRTHRELLSTLRIHSFGEWSTDFPSLRSQVLDGSLRTATRLWGAGGASISGDIATQAQAIGGTRPSVLPAEPSAARAAIDTWVSSLASEAGDILPAGEPANGTTLALTSGTALMVQPVGLAEAGPGSWHRADGREVPAAMLHGTIAGLAADPPECALAALPLADSRHLLVLAVPRTRDGLASLERSLTPERLTAWRRALKPKTVSVMIPRFGITRTVDLRQAMQQLGTSLPFGGQALFGTLGPAEPGRLRVGLWRSTAALALVGDERHDDVAAVDGARDGWPLTVDRPFWFGVLDPTTGTWLMIGRVVEPDPTEAPADVGNWADQVGGS